MAGLGTVKLLDLGLAGEPGLRRRTAMGTPRYMAPEQIGGEGVCEQTNQYALAVVIYEMLSGRSPWNLESRDIHEFAYKHVIEPPMPLAVVCPRVPLTVSQAIAVALAKNPKERWPSILLFSDALRDLDASRGRDDSGETDSFMTAPTLASLAAYETAIPPAPDVGEKSGRSVPIRGGVAEDTAPISAVESVSSAGTPEEHGNDCDEAMTIVKPKAVTVPLLVASPIHRDDRAIPNVANQSNDRRMPLWVAAPVLGLVVILATVGMRQMGRWQTPPERRASSAPTAIAKAAEVAPAIGRVSASALESVSVPLTLPGRAEPDPPPASSTSPVSIPVPSASTRKSVRRPPRTVPTSRYDDDGYDLF